METLILKIGALLEWLILKNTCIKAMFLEKIRMNSHLLAFIQEYIAKLQLQVTFAKKLRSVQKIRGLAQYVADEDQKAKQGWVTVHHQIVQSMGSMERLLCEKVLLQMDKDINYYTKLLNYIKKINLKTIQKCPLYRQAHRQKQVPTKQQINNHYSKEYETVKKKAYQYQYENPSSANSKEYSTSPQVAIKNIDSMTQRIRKELSEKMKKDLQRKNNKAVYGNYDTVKKEPQINRKNRVYKYLDNSPGKTKVITTSPKRQSSISRQRKSIEQKNKLFAKKDHPTNGISKKLNFTNPEDSKKHYYISGRHDKKEPEEVFPDDSLQMEKDELKLSDSLSTDIKTDRKQKTLMELLAQSVDSLRLQERNSLQMPDILTPEQYQQYEDSLQLRATGRFGRVENLCNTNESLSQQNQFFQTGRNQNYSIINQLEFSFARK